MSMILNNDKLRWKSEYNIGNATIDKEHQDLFLLAKEALSLVHAKNRDNSKDALIKIISKLFKFVRNHFKNEETYMAKIKYPQTEEHQTLHKDMLAMLTTLITSLNTLDKKAIEEQLCSFIEDYFIQHIIMEDKKIHLWIIPIEKLRKSFGWKDSYKVGDKQIDAEHKNLFDIAQKAFEVVEPEGRAKKVKSIVVSLYGYVQTHFAHEEEFMTMIRYPKVEAHKKLHQKIMQDLNDFIKKLPTLNVIMFEKELARFIDILLLQHIIHEDRQIMDWFKRGN